MHTKIAPSILSADFARLGQQVQDALDAGGEYIHVDVMDGHFVPNMSVGPFIVAAIEPIIHAAGAIIDVHLMVEKPERLIPAFAKAGADSLTVHVETCPHLHRTIQQIREHGIRAGVTLNPATPLNTLEEILAYVDLVLIMSVNPGFGGQNYISSSTDKINRLRRMLDERQLTHVELEVDGGLHAANVAEIVRAGATILVSGTAVFRGGSTVADNIAALQAAITD